MSFIGFSNEIKNLLPCEGFTPQEVSRGQRAAGRGSVRPMFPCVLPSSSQTPLYEVVRGSLSDQSYEVASPGLVIVTFIIIFSCLPSVKILRFPRSLVISGVSVQRRNPPFGPRFHTVLYLHSARDPESPPPPPSTEPACGNELFLLLAAILDFGCFSLPK